MPRVTNDKLKLFPFFSFPNTWNNLSTELKIVSSRNQFRFLLKRFLLNKVNEFSCSRLFCYSCSSATYLIRESMIIQVQVTFVNLFIYDKRKPSPHNSTLTTASTPNFNLG